MTASLEVSLIDRLIAGFPRSARQINAPHESDAELVRLPGGVVLAVTTDGIAEEIESGLYDPYTAGWMVVTANASDLAAVGADPLGIMVCETLPRHAAPDFVSAVQSGIRDAALVHALPVLGGDTNESDRLQLSATALGLVSSGPSLTRRGANPGDHVFSTGPLGLGSAFALAQLTGRGGVPFQPRARLAEGALIRRFASACMDTSDGLLPALHELQRHNGIGFCLSLDDADVLDPYARRAAEAASLPEWTMLAGPHGEFELICTVESRRRLAFLAAAVDTGFAPIELGVVTAEPGVVLTTGSETLTLDPGRIRNLFSECGGDLNRYVSGLLAEEAGGVALRGI